MVSNLVFSQLVLIAVVWLFLMLYGLWPAEPTATRPQTPKPLMPPRKRSKEPKSFMGLTHKPYCEACEQGVESRWEPPAPRHRLLSRHVAAGATSTPPTSSVLIPLVVMAAGSGSAIFALMAIRVVAPGVSCIAAAVGGIFWRPMARSFMANASRWTSSCT